MSKQAVKALVNAAAFLKQVGVTDVNLIGCLNDGKSREVGGKKLWRNAGKLACLIIGSAANAFSDFTDIRDGVLACIANNLDTWNQKDFSESGYDVDLSEALQRLADEVNAHIERAANAEPVKTAPIVRGLYKTEDGTIIAVTESAFGGDYPVRGYVVRGKNVQVGLLMCWTAAGRVFDYQCSNFDIVGRVF